MHLRAEPPPLSQAAARGQMDLRIARKVAALSGLSDDPGQPSGGADQGGPWYADYRLLTTTELSLGGPLLANDAAPPGVDDAGAFRRAGGETVSLGGDPAVKPLPIPSVTVNLYGPDTKAALMLTGVNRLLMDVHQAVARALEDIRWQVDDELLLVAVAQCLLQEVFESQPLLLLHGIQAGLIQRALRVSDVVQHRGTGAPPRIARLEYGWPRPSSEKDVTTDQIDITSAVWNQLIDETWPVYFADPKRGGRRRFAEPYLRFLPLEGYEQAQDFSSDSGADLRMRWVATLRDLTESHLGGVTPGVPRTSVLIDRGRSGRQVIEASIPRERQIELLMARIAPHLAPLMPGRGETTPGGADPATARPRAIGLPVIHSGYWRNCEVLQRRAVLLAHYYAIRAAGWIAGMRALNRKRDRAECARRYLDLVDAAEQLLAPDDPLLLQLSTYGRTYGLVYDSCRGTISGTTYRRVIGDAHQLIAMTRDCRYSRPKLLETLQNSLVGLTTVSYSARHFDPHQARMSRAEMVKDLGSLWDVVREFRAELGEGSTERDPDPGYEHAYALYLVSDPGNAVNLLQGIDMLAHSVIHRRAEAADRDGLRRGLRLSEQVYLKGLSNALQYDHGTAEQRADWAQQAMDKAEGLERSLDVRQVRAWLEQSDPKIDDRFDNSMLILLIRIAEGRVAALRNGGLDSYRGKVEEAVSTVTTYVEACGKRSQIDTIRLDQVAEIEGRYREWVEGGG